MKVLVFDSDTEVREVLGASLPGHELVNVDAPVSQDILRQHPDAEVVSLFVSSSLKEAEIDLLPQLKIIAARSAGVDNIACAYARGKGITIVRVPKYGQRTVAEFTFALILGLSRRLFDAAFQVREEGNFKTAALEGFDLFGKTLGVIGTGNIGRAVVSIASGFGMEVVMFDVFPAKELEGAHARYVPLDELLAQSDIVTLHVPYTAENYHLLGREQFAKMKHGAFVVNTARGELIDTEALIEALKTGQLGGAGLDVLEEEHFLHDEMQLVKGVESIQELKTLIRDHELLHMPRVIVTPHVAFFSREAYRDILQTTANNIIAFLAGKPDNTVSS